MGELYIYVFILSFYSVALRLVMLESSFDRAGLGHPKIESLYKCLHCLFQR